MIISKDVAKVFNKMATGIHDESYTENKMGWYTPQSKRGYMTKSTAKIILYGEKLEVVSLKPGMEKLSLISTPLQYSA